MPKPCVSPRAHRKFRYLSVCLCAQVYVNQPTNDDANYRYVTDKYLHPLWNATTRVADLALLKLESKFPNYETVKMPLILNNQLSKMQMVAFKGFGKINNDGQSVLSTDNSLTEQNMLRYLIVEQWDINGTSCFRLVRRFLKHLRK